MAKVMRRLVFSVIIAHIKNAVYVKEYGMERYNSVEVEVIKLSLRNIEGLGLSSADVLRQSVDWLREKYETTKDARYLDKAVWHIYAYLGMGYPYENGKEEFQSILDILGEKAEDVFPKRYWTNEKKVPLKKMRIYQLLGRWNPGLQSMKVADAVDDIIAKSQNREVGEYLYHCGKVIQQDGDKILWEHTFRLYIREDEAVFYDVNNGKYYVLGE